MSSLKLAAFLAVVLVAVAAASFLATAVIAAGWTDQQSSSGLITAACDFTDTDSDGLGDACDPCPANPDCDGDSLGLGDPFGLFFRDSVEVFMGTLPLVACPATPATDDEDPDATGADFDDSQDVDGSDVFLFAQRFGAELGVPPSIGKLPYIQRFDIYPTSASLNKIDGSDVFVLASYFRTSCP